MSELLTVLETLVAEFEADRPAVFCAVVEKRGSAPRLPGATMLVRRDGTAVGTVGGGAPEVAVCRAALACLPQGQPTLLELSLEEDLSTDDASICGGSVSIALIPVTTEPQAAPFRQALAAARRYESAQIPIRVEHQQQQLEYRLHVERPPTLLIAGGGHVGQAVARLAVELDFRVVVFDDRPEVATPERFGGRVELCVGDVARTLGEYPIDPSCYIVIMTRGHRHDQQALLAVIRRPNAYIGMIASQRKAAAVLANLADAGVPRDALDRVHTPIGLSIGAVTVNEIAISIAAELIRTRRQTTPKIIEGPLGRGDEGK